MEMEDLLSATFTFPIYIHIYSTLKVGVHCFLQEQCFVRRAEDECCIEYIVDRRNLSLSVHLLLIHLIMEWMD